MARIGLMLYSVRRACADDFEATLRAVAAMGYTGVEVFDLHGHDVASRARLARRRSALTSAVCTRLSPRSRQISPGLAATARGLGTDRLVVSWVAQPTSAAEAADVQRRLELVAAAAGGHGVRLGFHNHDGGTPQLRR